MTIRDYKIAEANKAIDDVRRITAELTPSEKEFLTEHSKEYRQLVDAVLDHLTSREAPAFRHGEG